MAVHRRHREQGRDGHGALGQVAVAQDEHALAPGHGRLRLPADIVERGGQSGAVAVGREADGQGAAGEVGDVEAAHAGQVLVGEDGVVQLDQPRLVGAFGQDVGVRAEEGHERHDQFLADGVDGRVGHLREELLEVPVEQLRLFGEDGQRLVGPHGADRLVAGDRHGVEYQLDVLAGVAEVLLAAEQAAGLGRGRRDGAEEAVDGDLVLLDPAPVGLAPREPGLDLHVFPHPVSGQVDQDHLSGPEGAFLLHLLGREVEHPRLGGEHHEPVLGDGVARGPQAVAVEQGPDHMAVAEGHRGGAVPGLHQAGVELEEAAQVGSHGVLRAPRLGDEHEHGVLDVAAAGGEQLEHVVEAGGVAAALVDDGQQLLEVGAEQVGLQLRLARADPVEVAAQGVDLAVVRQVAERLSQFPRGERVGAVALVDDGQGALEAAAR